MTLDQLRILVAIVDAGSFLAAAEMLHRTQPTISAAMKRLEQELGVSILDRSQYRAQLTPAGHRIYEKARGIIEKADELETLSHHLASGEEPRVAITLESSYPITAVIQLLQRWERQFPQTQFDLTVENVFGALDRLLTGHADIGIFPWLDEVSDVESFHLADAEMVVVAAPHFPPVGKAASLTLDDLRPYVQIVVHDSSSIPNSRSLGLLSGARYWYVNDQHTKRELILAGMGWGSMHTHLIEEDLAAGRLVPIQISQYSTHRQLEIRAARRIGESVGPVAAQLWQDLQERGVSH